MNLNHARKDKLDLIACILLFVLSFSFYACFVFNEYNVGGDSVSQYYPAKKLLKERDLNFWNSLNDKYRTYYFKLTFMDTVIQNWGESYPTQTFGTILLNAFIIGVFGNNAFFYINAFFASLLIVFIYLIVEELLKDRKVAILSSLILFSMPVFLFWAIITQNIMPATAFLIMSLYFIIKFRGGDKKLYLFLSGLFYCFSVFVRLPFALFFPAYLVFFANKNKKFKFDLGQITGFAAPFFIVFVLITLLKLKYFNNPFFEGYLRTNFHPAPPGSESFTTQMEQRYLFSNFSLITVFRSIQLFFIGSWRIYSRVFVLALLGLLIGIKEKNKNLFKFYFIIIFTISLIYYGNLRPVLWHYSKDSPYYWSLGLAFFRYLLPVYVLSIILLSFVIERAFVLLLGKTNKVLKTTIVFIVLILSVNYVDASITYKGGGSLGYILEVTPKIINYSKKINTILKKKSIILYTTRWAFSFTYPHTMEYNWFYYNGIPPKYRYQHTIEIVDKLLKDKHTVYFVHYDEPYDTLTRDVERELKRNFIFEYVDGTDFLRMKTKFYQLLPKNDSEI